MNEIDVHAARHHLHDGGEIAPIDVREAGQYGEGHTLLAVNCPYSKLELKIGALVPRLDARVYVIDGGDGIARKAAARLVALGYSAVSVVSGGMPSWQAAGFPVYKGVNVPSKTLGELAEAVWHPKTISAATLRDWKAEGKAFDFFDARPPEEYAKMRIPGARCLPNGELAHRLPVAANNDRLVVITCAGRTRGITGAIGLKLAGYPGEVMALENGTQGWALAGETLERGNMADPFPALGKAAMTETLSRAKTLMERFSIARVTAAQLPELVGDGSRTVYRLDVRSSAEARGEPLEGAVHAPSGQLVQATDQWIGVRHSRLILFDDGGLRAALAAFWLKQLGYEPYVALIDDDMRAALGALSQKGERASAADRGVAPPIDEIEPNDALAEIRSGHAVLVDTRPSVAYRKGHIEGAIWFVRPKAVAVASRLGDKAALIIAEDAASAALAASDLSESGVSSIAMVKGGQRALETAGAPVVATPDEPSAAEAIDYLFFVHDRHDGNLEASRRYLEWETGLIHQMDEVERAEFKLIHPAA